MGQSDPDTQIFIIQALGNIGNEEAIPSIIDAAGSDDPGVRMMAVYALGAFSLESVRPTLYGALNDPSHEVRWNAALTLARQKDDSGLAVIERMLDREYIDRVANIGSEQQKDEVMANALKAVALLEAEDLRQTVEDLSRNDRSVRVRRHAHETLRALRDEVSMEMALESRK